MSKRIYMILCLVWSIILCGCAADKKEEGEMYLYYINGDGNALVQEVCPQMSVEETLEKLLKPGNVKKNSIMVPKEISLDSYTVNGNQLILSFESQYSSMKKSTEVLFRAAMVQTMVQVEDISFVSFYVGGNPLKDADGNAIGWMQAEDFVQSVGYAAEAYLTTDLRLYYATQDGMMLKQVKKNNVKFGTNTSVEKLVVEQLMKGTSASGAKATIPKTTKLLSVSLKDGICYVSFDSKFATDAYDQNPEVTIYSIVNSIIENGNANKVQILIEGSQDMLYKGTVDLSLPLEWNETIILEEQK